MKIAIFAYSHGGCAAARRVRAVLAEAETVCYAVPRLEEAGFLPLAKDIYRECFSSMDALIFIGACGIAVREIAPYLVSKKTDPAVLCIDEKMQFVIPLLFRSYRRGERSGAPPCRGARRIGGHHDGNGRER